MTILNEFATEEEIENFLFYHMDSADNRKSIINPSLTKQQVWDINMDAITRGNVSRVKSILIKNITNEFGKYYGD